MSKFVQQRITKVLSKAVQFNWDDVLVRYSEKFGYKADVVDLHARELLRFLALAASVDEPLPMEGPIDALWHEFVLHSELYASFCESATGRFIHHQPGKAPQSAEEQQESRSQWARFSELYLEAFGEDPPLDVWPATDPAELGSREWWQRRLERVAVGSQTQAWWWSDDTTSSSTTGSITYCNTNDTTGSTASDTCTTKHTGGGSTG